MSGEFVYTHFIEYLSELSDTEVHIILHHNADPDAICAAEAFGNLILSLNPSSRYLLYSDDINTSATRIMKELNISVLSSFPELSETKKHIIFTVDTANMSQLGKYADWVEKSELPLIVVDHHHTSELADRAMASLIDINSSSTCALAYQSFNSSSTVIEDKIATLLIAGHLYDSRRLLYGTTVEILQMLADLITNGGDYENANRLLQNKMSHGEKIARFKATQRLKYHIIGKDIIVVTSKIGAFEASAARSILNIGADIAFVLAPKEKELRASARAFDHLDLNIGEIMSVIAKEFGGSGGGHAAAAGFNIVPLPSNKIQKQIAQRFVELVKSKIIGETN